MYPYTRYFPSSLFNMVADASNIRLEKNPDYTLEQFYEFYPQFKGQVSDTIVQSFINIASCNINKARWNCQWELGMSLLVAHFLTLYVQTVGTTEDPNTNLQAGMFRGVQSSKSVDSVSVSYDVSAILGSTGSWGAYQLTQYGIQLLTLARLLGKGGMYVH